MGNGVETARAKAAYAAYAALGPTRSLAKLAQTSDFGRRMCEQWSVQWGWQARVALYDQEQAERVAAIRREREAERERLREEMLDQHALWGRELFGLAVARLAVLIQRDEMGSDSAVKLLHEAYTLQRLALGVADVAAHTVAGVISLEQLRVVAGEVDAEQTRWEAERGYGNGGL